MQLNSYIFWTMVFLSVLGFIRFLSVLKFLILSILYLFLKRIKKEDGKENKILVVDIEPCPICGNPVINIYKNYISDDLENEDAVGYICKCSYCGLTSPMLRKPKDVLNYWNTRNGKLMHEWKEGQE